MSITTCSGRPAPAHNLRENSPLEGVLGAAGTPCNSLQEFDLPSRRAMLKGNILPLSGNGGARQSGKAAHATAGYATHTTMYEAPLQRPESVEKRYDDLLADAVKINQTFESLYTSGRTQLTGLSQNDVLSRRRFLGAQISRMTEERVGLLRSAARVTPVSEFVNNGTRRSDAAEPPRNNADLNELLNVKRRNASVAEISAVGEELLAATRRGADNDFQEVLSESVRTVAEAHGYQIKGMPAGTFRLHKGDIECALGYDATAQGIISGSPLVTIGIWKSTSSGRRICLYFNRAWEVACTDAETLRNIDDLLAIFA